MVIEKQVFAFARSAARADTAKPLSANLYDLQKVLTSVLNTIGDEEWIKRVRTTTAPDRAVQLMLCGMPGVHDEQIPEMFWCRILHKM
jgi:hypothetical protein